jgi:hypothetical protein
MNERIGFNWGVPTPLNPSLGYVGGHLNLGIGQLSFSVDQDGVGSGGFSWTGLGGAISIDGNAEIWGWNKLAPHVEVGHNLSPRRNLWSRLIRSAALFSFVSVNTAFADMPVADENVNMSCFFSVRCEVGSADCELMSGTRTYSFASQSSINVQPGFSVFASTERSDAVVLTVQRSGEARMLEFRMVSIGGAQSVGYVSFGRCEYGR